MSYTLASTTTVNHATMVTTLLLKQLTVSEGTYMQLQEMFKSGSYILWVQLFFFRVRNVCAFNLICHVAHAHAIIIHHRKLFVPLIFAA